MKKKNIVLLSIALSLPVLASVAGLAYIATHLDQAARADDGEPAVTSSAGNNGTSMVTYAIPDPTMNLVAGSYMHPAGWRADTQIKWNIEHFSQVYKLHSIAQSPDGLSALEFFPAEQFCWLVPNPGFKRIGMDMGDGSTFLPPVSAVDAMTNFELNKLRGNIPDLKVISVTPLPDLGQSLGVPVAPGSVQGGVVARLTYTIDGKPVEEEIYGLGVAFPDGKVSYGGAGKMIQYNWGFSTLFAFRTAAGGMDAARPTFVSMVKSFKPNPAWQSCRAQFQQRALQHNNFRLQLTQQSIDNANMLSKAISAGNEQFFRHQAERREYQAVSDQMRIDARHGWGAYSSNGGGGGSGYSRTDAVNDLLGGTETYQDGSVHSGYNKYMWSDGQGNYRGTNNPLENPNVGSSSNWTLIEKKQLGQ